MLRISKGGKLIENEWVYDKEKEEGSYVDFDRTENAIRHLFDACELEEGITLKDVFLLLNTELDIFDSVLGNWCKEIVTEGLSKEPKIYDLSVYSPDQIEYLELYFTPGYESYEGKDSFYGFSRPDFHGVGVVLQEEKDFYKKGERIPWGISFTPANELINIPVKLNKEFTIYHSILSKPEYDGSPDFGVIKRFNNPQYTLGHILNGIIWEMSFYGGPETRDGFNKELHDTKNELEERLKNGEEVGIPIEEWGKMLNDGEE